MLCDYRHDINMLTTTYKLLGKDLHYGEFCKFLFTSLLISLLPLAMLNN